MKKILTFFIVLTFINCDFTTNKPSSKSETVVYCSSGYWCDKETTKTFYRTGLFTYGAMGTQQVPGTKSSMYLTYNKSSKIFDLQIKRVTRYVNEYWDIGHSPNTYSNTVWISRDGRVVDRVRILNMSEYKISFKSSVLEDSFNNPGRYEIDYKQSWGSTVYAVDMEL